MKPCESTDCDHYHLNIDGVRGGSRPLIYYNKGLERYTERYLPLLLERESEGRSATVRGYSSWRGTESERGRTPFDGAARVASSVP